ncbi:hypothetical protein [Paenibacillus odorifer]|uniref:hypothetical protein n=1 Tax=Paenibacillus odorifer TaxID=189426 RepID=UPI00096C4C9D|nr:hypothetical protein [Paenibacillus odorifer]OMD74164.1 hypothetical protein BSK50_21290 [Paenibacillus odorifer]
MYNEIAQFIADHFQVKRINVAATMGVFGDEEGLSEIIEEIETSYSIKLNDLKSVAEMNIHYFIVAVTNRL